MRTIPQKHVLKVGIILGTRPEIIKMSPILKALKKVKTSHFVVHSNQHYSKNLDSIFFSELKLITPEYNLRIGSGLQGEQTGKMLAAVETVLLAENPDVVLVQGDTNTALAGALAAVKLGIKVGHIEAGLRSYARNMPEEINRILIDHCADFLFAPTKSAAVTLRKEGIPSKKIFVVGNTIVDAVVLHAQSAEKTSHILKKLNLEPNGYFLATAHRQENTDNKDRLENMLKGIMGVSEYYNLPVIYPAHPRTLKMMDWFDIKLSDSIHIVPPMGYFDFLKLQKNARCILTDSGGLQEEACILKVPCVTLRDNTERPETVEVGANILAGTDPKRILRAVQKMSVAKRAWKNPFGDGTSAQKIVRIILQKV